MLSRNLEETIHRSIDHAARRRHEFATLEHLMLGLCEDPDAAHVLRACDVKIERLSGKITGYIDSELGYLVAPSGDDPRPTDSFTRALQRAAIHVQSSGRDEVTGANVLIAIFSERESHAVYFLQEQGMTRFDAVSFIPHGVAKVRELSETRERDGTVESWQRWDTYVPQGLAGPSSELKEAVERAVGLARECRHEFVTLEHLLLSLTECEDVLAFLGGCQVDVARLRQDLTGYLDTGLGYMASEENVEPRAADGTSRALARAAMHARSVGDKHVTGVAAVAAMYDAPESRAVFSLRDHHISVADALNYMSHGNANKGRRE